MVSYTDPQAPTLPNPVGFDAEIQRLQLLLKEELPWLQVSYGKAYRATKKAPTGNKALAYPEVYVGAREYRDVLPNDHVVAQSFFYPTGPATNPEREPIPGALGFTQPCDVIVWANLEKVDPTKTWRYESELLVDVVRVLSEDGQCRVVRAYTTPEEVFKGFAPELLGEAVLRQPYAGFRVSLELSIADMLC